MECWRRELDLQGGQSCVPVLLHCNWPAHNDSSSMDRQSFSESVTAVSVRSCSRLFEENVFYVRANCGCEFVINVVTRDKMSQEIVTG